MRRNSTFVKWIIYFIFGVIIIWGVSQIIGYLFMIKWGIADLNHQSAEKTKQDEIQFSQKINNLVVNKDYDKVIYLINTRIRTNNDSTTALLQDLGSVYYLKGKLDSAILLFSQAIQTSDFYPDGYANRGYILETQGKLKSAIQDYQKAASDVPGYNFELGLALEKDGQIIEAYQAYLRFLDYDSSNIAILRKVDSLEHSGIPLKDRDDFISWDEFQNGNNP